MANCDWHKRGAMNHENADLMKSVLASLSPREREVLERIYVKEQSQEQICEEMDLSETQLRLLKNRSKARFGALHSARSAANSTNLRVIRFHA